MDAEDFAGKPSSLEEWVCRENLRRFGALLMAETSEEQRAVWQGMLDRELQKLKEITG